MNKRQTTSNQISLNKKDSILNGKKRLQVFSISIIIGLMLGCSGTRPENIGINYGKFAPCSPDPNCVCSQSDQTDTEHFIQPLSYQSSKEDAERKLAQILTTQPRCEIVKMENGYIYAEFTSFLMRFKDDVQFYFDDSSKIIHVKSASRLGSGDLGVNRKRIETIRTEFNK